MFPIVTASTSKLAAYTGKTPWREELRQFFGVKLHALFPPAWIKQSRLLQGQKALRLRELVQLVRKLLVEVRSVTV